MPESLPNLLATGGNLLRGGRLAEAQQFSTALLARYRGHPLVHLFAADVADAHDDRKSAIGYLESLPPDARADCAACRNQRPLAPRSSGVDRSVAL